MQWSHLNLEEGIWTIPSMEMKREKYEKENGEDHLVPLPTQAIEILKEVKRYTGKSIYVFRGERTANSPMSDGTINKALRTLGFGEEQCGHGFRASDRTMLDEILNKDWRHLEAQLAHAVKDVNGKSYNRTQFIRQRVELMQDWANYLDEIKLLAKRGETHKTI
jgi:integrase